MGKWLCFPERADCSICDGEDSVLYVSGKQWFCKECLSKEYEEIKAELKFTIKAHKRIRELCKNGDK